MSSIITLEPLRVSEVPAIRAFARAIWREHYIQIITEAQIEYMLRAKYTQADLEPYVGALDRWFDMLRVDGELGGFLRCSKVNTEDFKIEEIYLAKSQRGKGLGKLLLDRAESLARQQRCNTIFLYVNRANENAVAAYRKSGFVVKEAKLFDIGHGFVMDDYLMQKSLGSKPVLT